MKVKVYISGLITNPDGKTKDVLVCEREDGERLETILSKFYDFDKEADKLIAQIKLKPKRKIPKAKEVELEI